MCFPPCFPGLPLQIGQQVLSKYPILDICHSRKFQCLQKKINGKRLSTLKFNTELDVDVLCFHFYNHVVNMRHLEFKLTVLTMHILLHQFI